MSKPNPLFMPTNNGKRPYPDSSRNRQDGRSPPPPPGLKSTYANGSSAPLSHSNNRPRPSHPPPPPPPLSAPSYPSAPLGPSRPTLPPHGLSPSTARPFPPDLALKAKLESILAQILHLFKLQSQTLESSSTAGSGSWEVSDLATEEAEELKRLWDQGSKEIGQRERKERESLGNSVVDNLGGLLMQLVDKVGTDIADRKVEVLKRQVEALKSSTPQQAVANSGPPTHPPTQPSSSYSSASSRPDPALSDALARIHTLEKQLSESDKERHQLRKDLADKDKAFEQRLSALENRTSDPRRRVSASGSGTGNGSPGLPTDTKQQAEIDSLKKEVEDLRSRVAKAEDSAGNATREEAETMNTVKVLKVEVGGQAIQVRDLRAEYDELQEKIRNQITHELNSLELPSPTGPSITELESALLRGIHEFLSSTQSASLGSASSSDITQLLRDRLSAMFHEIASLTSKTLDLETSTETYSKQIEILYKRSQELGPWLNVSDENALPADENGASTSQTSQAQDLPGVHTSITNSEPSRREDAHAASGGGAVSGADVTMAEKSDRDSEAAVARQLGVNSVDSGDRGASSASILTNGIQGGRGAQSGFAADDDDDED